MARLHVVYNGTGITPSVFTWCHDRTPLEIENKIEEILNDRCLRIPSDQTQVQTLGCRTTYVIPLHEIKRFVIELTEGEECPDPHG